MRTWERTSCDNHWRSKSYYQRRQWTERHPNIRCTHNTGNNPDGKICPWLAISERKTHQTCCVHLIFHQPFPWWGVRKWRTFPPSVGIPSTAVKFKLTHEIPTWGIPKRCKPKIKTKRLPFYLPSSPLRNTPYRAHCRKPCRATHARRNSIWSSWCGTGCPWLGRLVPHQSPSLRKCGKYLQKISSYLLAYITN